LVFLTMAGLRAGHPGAKWTVRTRAVDGRVKPAHGEYLGKRTVLSARPVRSVDVARVSHLNTEAMTKLRPAGI
jgi:hypothetical protein